MATSFKSLVSQFVASHAKLETLAAEMRQHFEDPTDRAFIRSECLPVIVEIYAVKMVAKERGEGTTFPDTANGKTAANMLSRLVAAIAGPKSGHTEREPVKVSRAAHKAAVDFVALCGSKTAAIAAIKALK